MTQDSKKLKISSLMGSRIAARQPLSEVSEGVSVSLPILEEELSFSNSFIIPLKYHKSFLALMVRDPFRIHAYWEIAPEDMANLNKELGADASSLEIVLRVYDVPCKKDEDSSTNYFFDIEVGDADSWDIDLCSDQVCFCAEIGIRNKQGQFFPIKCSNQVTTPRVKPSGRTDLIWMEVSQEKVQPFVVAKAKEASLESRETSARRYFLTEDDVRSYYAKNFSLKDLIKPRPKIEGGSDESIQEIFIEDAIIPGLSKVLNADNTRLGSSDELMFNTGSSNWLQGISSRDNRIRDEKDVFLEIDPQCIFSGRTKPGSTVWFRGKKIRVNADGTFVLKCALPQGKTSFDFVAEASDHSQTVKLSTSVDRSNIS